MEIDVTTITIAYIVLVSLYGIGLYFWIKKTSWRLSEKVSNRIKYFHYVLATLVIVSVMLELVDNLSFSGQWTTRIIIVGFLISGILIYPLTNEIYKARIEKHYFRVFSFLPILTGFLAMVPFLGIIIIASLFGQLIEPVNKMYYDNDKIRVQSSFTGVLGPPDLLIYEKKGLLKKRLNDSYRIYRYAGDDLDSVKVYNEKESTLIIMYNKAVVLDTLKIKRME